MVIKSILARKILASMGNETVEATIKFEDGSSSTASVPAGISAGKYEVKKVSPDEAINQISKMNVMCAGKDWVQETLDQQIGKSGYGGNATLAVSAAFFKGEIKGTLKDTFKSNTGSRSKNPKLMVLMFEGGEHGNKNITFQEFLVIEESVDEARSDFQKIRKYLQENNSETTVGAEGGFSPEKYTNKKALEVIRKVLPGKEIALDVASSFSQTSDRQFSPALDGAGSNSIDRVDYYKTLVNKYSIVSLEDPFDDEDWINWTNLAKSIGGKVMIVGDDLTVTNPERIKKAIEEKAINAVIIKPNQIGTISGAKAAVKIAQERGLKVIVSHRGEETDDDWIADFAVDVSADFVKFGGMNRGERVVKYNRLLELGRSESQS